MRVLVIENNPDISANVCDYLSAKGHMVSAAVDGPAGLCLATTSDYDAIVLDVMLPGMDGIELCSRLRHDSGKATPVLMLTVRDSLQDKLHGFNSGADDYLTKPFALQELEARLQALARRGTAEAKQDAQLQVADLTLDTQTLRVQRAGRALNLSPISLKILRLLMEQSHRVVERREISAVIWGDSPPDSDALRAHMHILRNTIDQPFSVPLLHNVRGIGYRLVDPNAL
ncbi:MAG: response regulator transcription factor [Gammaproteobacteria bacterium]|nr:response regulator transcription factor [Gammaproteobacteria bacterium]